MYHVPNCKPHYIKINNQTTPKCVGRPPFFFKTIIIKCNKILNLFESTFFFFFLVFFKQQSAHLMCLSLKPTWPQFLPVPHINFDHHTQNKRKSFCNTERSNLEEWLLNSFSTCGTWQNDFVTCFKIKEKWNIWISPSLSE